MTATTQPDRSPAPGIIPEPVHLTDGAAAVTGPIKKRAEPNQGRRNPFGIAFARVMSALHGDKYMVDAYPAEGHQDAAASDDAGPRTG